MTTNQQSGREFSSSLGIIFAFPSLPLGDGGGAWAQSASLLVTNPAQPPNVGDAIIAAAAYKESGTNDSDVASVAQQPPDWIGERAPSVPGPALVLDIDETALSNWEVITRDNFGRPISGPAPRLRWPVRLGRLGSTRPRSGDRADPARSRRRAP